MQRPSTEQLLDAAREAEALRPTGRFDLPDYTSWPSFPFEGDLRVKAVEEAAEEPDRHGTGGVDCHACATPDQAYLWYDDTWRIRSTDAPTGLPIVLFLETRQHADLHDLPDAAMADLGLMIRRVERALLSLGGVVRVQLARWGDGAEHFHLWFFPRPEGFLQGRGAFLTHWDDILPPRPEAEWQQTRQDVAAALRRL